MDVNKCPHCGKELPSESKFCPYCMERINEPMTVSVPKEKKTNKKILAIVILVFILLLTMVIALFAHLKNAKGGEYVNNEISTEETNDFNGVDVSEGGTTDMNNADKPNLDDTKPNKPSTENVDTKEESKTTNKNSASTSTTNANKGTISTTNTTAATTNVTTTQCAHNWIKQTKIVHYDEVGHYEIVQKQRPVTLYKCPVCYKKFQGLNEYYNHFDGTHKPSYSGDPVTILRNQYTTETGYEYYNVQEWVVDREAYDETVVTGYKCKNCGKEKSS